MRGKELEDNTIIYKGRITPACAGKRFVLGHRFRLQRDHPRLCGEKLLLLLVLVLDLGSPPLVRGKD